MKYCPYCASPLTSPSKICPYCKKSLDFELLKEILEPGETSRINKKLMLKVWFKEKSFIIYPVITLIIGFIAGAILLYGYAQVQFAGQKSDYQDKIATLEQTIDQQKASSGNVQSDLQNQLQQKEAVIGTLIDQKDIYSKLVYFTSRLVSNGVLNPASPDDIDYYKRNTLYLIRLFEEAQSKLQEAGVETDKQYNLQTIPSLLESTN